MSPLPTDLVSGPDLLPPSPSVHAPLNRLPTRPHQPPIPLHIVTTTPSPDQIPTSSSSSLDNTTTTTTEVLKAPPVIKPLDLLASAASSAETHAELARTVDDLAKWLTIVETGLSSILEKSFLEGGGTVIQENREEEEDDDDLGAGSDFVVS